MVVEIRRNERRFVEQAAGVTPVRPSQTAAGMLGEGLGQVGDALGNWTDEVATAEAKTADASLTESINGLLYGENGFMYAQGGNAVAMRESVTQELDKLYKTTLDGLSPIAKAKAEAPLRARLNSYQTRVNERAFTASQDYLNDAAAARVTSLTSAAILDPDGAPDLLAQIDMEIADIAARKGSPDGVTALERQGVRDKVYGETAMRYANIDPMGALDFVRKHRDEISGPVLARLEAELVPIAKEFQGRQMGASAFTGVNLPALKAAVFPGESGGDYDALFGFSNRDGGQFANVRLTDMTVDEALAFADPSGPYGQWVAAQNNGTVATPMGAFQVVGSTLRAAKDGLGLTGTEKMTREMQDRIGMWVYGAQGPGAWEGWRGPRLPVASSYAQILEIEDPLVREAAIREFDLRSKARQLEDDEIQRSAATTAYETIIQGGRIADLDVETRLALGRVEMSGLMSLERAWNSASPPQTNPVAYTELRLKQANDPQGFRQMVADGSLITGYADKLSPTDMQGFIDAGTTPQSEVTRTAAATLMTVADRHMKDAGIDTTPKEGSDDAAAVAAMQTRLLRWQDVFIAKEGRAPMQGEIDARVKQELVEVVTGAGWGDGQWKNTRSLYQIDFEGMTADEDDDMSLFDLENNISEGAMRIAGQKVDMATYDQVYAALTRALNGLTPEQMAMADIDGLTLPTPRQIVEALATYYE